MGDNRSLRRLLILACAVSLGACAPRTKNAWRAAPPRSQAEAGYIVQSTTPIQGQLESLMLAQGASGRIISTSHQLFEVHDLTPEQIATLGDNVIVEKNVYMPNLINEVKKSSMLEKALASSDDSNDVMNQLRQAGFKDCVRLPDMPEAVITSNADDQLQKGPLDERKLMKFDANHSVPAPGQTTPLLYAFELEAPHFSDIKGGLYIGDKLEFTPDLLGSYSVALLVQDDRGACSMAHLQFAVTANPDFEGPKTPTALSDDKMAKFFQLDQVDAREAWKVTRGKDAVIAVVDTGVHYNHQDLAQNILLNEQEIPNNQIDDDKNGFVDDVLGWDFINSDNKPYDDQGHGSHVAGLAASSVVGIAPEAKILAVKAMNASGGGDLASIVGGIYYAVDRGAHVINASFGSTSTMMKTMQRATDYAESKGVIFVAAAGNGDQNGVGMDNDVTPHYPSSLPNSNLLSVAALDGDALTRYSNYGVNSVAVAAPGGAGRNPLFSTSYENPKARYIGLSGTSMASPVVAGVMALARSAFPALAPKDLIAQALVSGPTLHALEGKIRSGRRINAKELLEHLRQPAPLVN